MDREIRNLLERTTQQARRLLEGEYGRQIEGTFDILSDGTILTEPGGHLTKEEALFRSRLVAAIEHRRALENQPGIQFPISSASVRSHS